MTPLPTGFRLRADPRLRRHDGDHVLVGGAPRRVLRLSDRGAQVAGALLAGAAVTTTAEGALARRLADAGMAHPLPPDSTATVDVVVPAYDDPRSLARCLDRLGGALGVVVVDDGSKDAAAVRRVAERHGARLVRLDTNRGPAGARNAGTMATTAPFVAFVDSDALVTPDTLRRLADHFADPGVAAVAPRVRPAPTATAATLGSFADVASPLDLGADSALVGPQRRVGYVPSTVLLVRRTALDAVGGFDESLRYGEDVDLTWRLTEAGQQVRYDADLEVHHAEPTTWSRWLRRRFSYGTSAAPLTVRHGARAVSVTMRPAPLAAVGLAVAGRPRLGAAVAVGTAVRIGIRLRRAGVPAASTTAAAALAPVHTALASSRWLTQLWWPALAVAATRSPRRRAVVAVVAVAPPLVTWAVRRPRLDPVRWTLASWADDVAYGLGVWTGCVRARTAAPVLPRLAGPAPRS